MCVLISGFRKSFKITCNIFYYCRQLKYYLIVSINRILLLHQHTQCMCHLISIQIDTLYCATFKLYICYIMTYKITLYNDYN